MNTEQQWQELKTNYLKRVEQTLAAISHPKTADILHDVAEHLDSKYAELPPDRQNWEAYQQIITEMGPPQEYAELLTEQNPPIARKTFGLNELLAVIFVVTLLVVGGYLIYSAKKPPAPVPQVAVKPIAFELDERVLGKWMTVDFVEHIDSFKPDRKSWSGSLFLQSLDFQNNGSLVWRAQNRKPWKLNWTKGKVDPRDKRPSFYYLRNVDGQLYVFYEWVSGDVTDRGQNPWYYVLKKTQDAAAFIISFKPVSPFEPQTARELLNAFNLNHPQGVRTHHYRTKIQDDQLVGLICVDNEAAVQSVIAMLKNSDTLELLNAVAASPEEFEAHCGLKQLSLPAKTNFEKRPDKTAQHNESTSTGKLESNSISAQAVSKPHLSVGKAGNVTPSQVATNEVSQEQRSVWAYYRMGTVARHKGDAQEAAKAYESIIKISAGQQDELSHKIISSLYLAEIASEIQKDKPLAVKRLQDALLAMNSQDTAKREPIEVGAYTIMKDWLSYQLAKLQGRQSSAVKTSFNNSELDGIFMLVMGMVQMSIEGTGLTCQQLAQDGKSPIDSDIALLALAYGCLPDNGRPDFPNAEKYFASLARRDSYFASYAAVMLTKLQEEEKKESQRQLKQEEVKPPQETIPEISADQIPRLMEDIKSLDGKVRQAAMRKLTVKAGPEGLKALEQAQKSPDKSTRYWAAIALSHAEQTSIKPDIHLLIEAMGEPEQILWWEAACALNGTNPPMLEREEIVALVAMAKCPEDRTVDRSGDMAEILGNCLSAKAEIAVPEIINLLRDDNEYTQMNACVILRKMGPSAVAAFPGLVKYLSCNDDAVRSFAIEAMKSINPKETEILLQKQANKESVASQKRTAELTPKISAAIEKLNSPDVEIRRQGMNVFTLLQQEPEWEMDTATEPGKQVISALIKAASDPDYSVCTRAKETLCTLHAVEAMPIYIDILSQKPDLFNSSLKVQAAKAVGAIGPAAKDAVPALNQVASVEKSYVGNAARDALRSICGDAVDVPLLMEDLKSSQKETRRSAIWALSRIRSEEAKAAIPILIEILNNESEDEHCRIEAARTLGRMKAAEAIPVLVKLSREKDVREFMLRHECMNTLGLMEETAKPAIPVLIGILKNKAEDAGTRGKAARALGNLKAEEAIPLLITILKQKGELADMGEDSIVRSNAAVALGLMGAKAKEALPVLEECLKDEYSGVSKAASEAIKKIKG